MELTFDTIVVALIVACAALFIARRVWRSIAASRAARAGCTSCGCGDEKDPMTV